jgi:hypothetical protein
VICKAVEHGLLDAEDASALRKNVGIGTRRRRKVKR